MRRVYIDEAGDRGAADGSSRYFVVSAVVVDDADDSMVREEMSRLKQLLRRGPDDVLHFRNLTHSQKIKACQEIASLSVQGFASVVICKKALNTPFPDGGLAYIAQPDPMYLWAIRLLLERVSWLIRDTGGGTSIVTFAHLKRFKADKLHSYRDALRRSSTKIHWPSFEGHNFRLSAPSHTHLLRVADICASALFKAVEPDEHGNPEQRYLTELRPIIYRRGSGPVTSYGLKVFPVGEAKPGGSLHHLRLF